MADNSEKAPLSYRDAGVDIDAGNALVERIKPSVKRTHRPGVMGGLGGFGGLFELPVDRYKKPILVSGTDGVGTKLSLAQLLQKHDTIGIDLVAMCANDILVCGAEPLYFLDYFSTGHLSVDIAATVIDGIAKGCEQAGCALIGGETAEMPGMYEGGDYDLAGFCVGVVEQSKIIDGSTVQAGDILIGLPSSGPHSNGYSLIRKIIQRSNLDLSASCGNEALGAALLAPTQIYVKPILRLLESFSVKAMAHITGGGLTENIPRVLPSGLSAVIDLNKWQLPPVFQLLAHEGQVANDEMLRTFNCGIGFVLCVSAEDSDAVINALQQADQAALVIGEIAEATDNTVQYIDRIA